MNRKTHLIMLCLMLGVLFLLTSTVAAQDTSVDGACPALVQRAITEIGNNCNNLDRNSACYGYDRVNAVFNDEVPTGFFTQPSDRTELNRVQSLTTNVLDLENEIWGVAVLNVQANIPNTLPGQAVTFVLMGDSTMQNAVSSDVVQPYIVPVALTLEADVEGFSVPDRNASVVATIPTGTQVLADAKDEIGWLRVVFNDLPMWIRGEDAPQTLGLDALPILTGEPVTPMQAFYFETGVGQPACNEAPNVITVQSPDNIEVVLNVNGVDVSIGSTISMQSTSDSTATFSVHEGHLEVLDDGTMVTTGESMDVMLDDTGNISDWETPRPSTEEEMALETMTRPAFEAVGVEIPHATDGDESTSTDNNPDQVIHIVAVGETLFSIARFYEASMPRIVALNNIRDVNNIVVGQRLIIPNPGSGFVGMPAPQTPTTDDDTAPVTTEEAPIATGDCSTFGATSPTAGLAFGANTFYWNPVAGATGYQVFVTNAETGQTIVIDAPANATSASATLDGRTIGFGFEFSWHVKALRDGEVICTSQTIRLQRESETVTPPASFAANVTCAGVGSYSTTFSWSGLGAETVTFTFLEGGSPASFGAFSGDSGTQTKYTAGSSVDTIVATTSGGTVFNIAGIFTCL